MSRRQFLAACLMLLVGVCLLDLKRLREWWDSIGGAEIDQFASYRYEWRIREYATLVCNQPGYTLSLVL